MTETTLDRTAWLEERLTGIGGSEAASVFNMGWGCQRQLTYEKRRVPEDYPFDQTLIMALGNLMEPFFAEQYAEKTGRIVSQASSFSHPDHPELRVNVDRIIGKVEGKKGHGVLEIKSQGRGAWSKTKHEGLNEQYIIQIQWGMVVTGCEWGSFAIGCRDSGELMHWDVEIDPDIREAILEDGPALWSRIKSDAELPARLEPDDKRCGSCQWRRTCHGDSLIRNTDNDKLPSAEDIRPLLIEYDEVNAKFTEKLPDGSRGTVDDLRLWEIKEQIKATLDKRDAVRVPWSGKDRKVYFRQQDGRTSWKTEEMAKAYEGMRAALRTTEKVTAESLDMDVEAALAKVDETFPPAESFMRVGVPYRTLRVF